MNRTSEIKLRVTADEAAAIHRQADAHGLSVSAWIRRAAISGGENLPSRAAPEPLPQPPVLPAVPAANVPEVDDRPVFTCGNPNCENYGVWRPRSKIRCNACYRMAVPVG